MYVIVGYSEFVWVLNKVQCHEFERESGVTAPPISVPLLGGGER